MRSQARLGVNLPATLVFDYPSVTAISSYISNMTPLSAVHAATAAAAAESTAAGALARPLAAPVAPFATEEPMVGIVAAAMVTPAHNSSLFSLQGKDVAQRVPYERWDVDDQGQVREGSVFPC